MINRAFWDIAELCVASAAVTAVICYFAAGVGRAIRVMDKPDGARKLHQSDTPLIGGLALLLPALGASLFYCIAFSPAPIMLVVIAAALAVFTIGLIDDRTGLSATLRVALLTLAIATVLAVDPLFILHTLAFKIFGLTLSIAIPDLIAAPFVIFMILGFVNAANMADGMNGQLLGSVMLWSAFIVHYMGIDAGFPFIILISSSLVVFAFNLRGRLFAGSSGAYAASLFVAFGAIGAYRLANGAMAAQVPVYWFWLPVLDCVRLMISRTWNGKSPFAADRNHFHHMLLEQMRPSRALLSYLALVAAPGFAAMVNDEMASVTLLLCIAAYIVFIAAKGWSAAVRPARSADASRLFAGRSANARPPLVTASSAQSQTLAR